MINISKIIYYTLTNNIKGASLIAIREVNFADLIWHRSEVIPFIVMHIFLENRDSYYLQTITHCKMQPSAHTLKRCLNKLISFFRRDNIESLVFL